MLRFFKIGVFGHLVAQICRRTQRRNALRYSFLNPSINKFLELKLSFLSVFRPKIGHFEGEIDHF